MYWGTPFVCIGAPLLNSASVLFQEALWNRKFARAIGDEPHGRVPRVLAGRRRCLAR